MAKPGQGCDLCSVSSSVEARIGADGSTADPAATGAGSILGDSTAGRPGAWGFTVGALEMFTSKASLTQNGSSIPNFDGQYLDTWETEALIAYRFSARYGARVYIPYLYRRYRRDVGGETVDGTVYGIGDTSLELTAVPWRLVEPDRMVLLTLFLGTTLPTGDSDLLEEEQARAASSTSHGHGGSSGNFFVFGDIHAVHGHQLALGTGAFDPLFGFSSFLRRERWFLTAHGQYTVGTTGDFSYRCGDQFEWGGGPGWRLWSAPDTTVGIQLNCSGEWNAHDHVSDELVPDSGGTFVYLGPEVPLTMQRVSGELGVDIPIYQHANGLQLVDDYRVHAGISLSF